MAEKKFEQYMERLEEIVHGLENGAANLDDTLSLYEEGVKIAKKCNKMLDDAQQKVTVLAKGEGGISEKEFEGEL